MTEKINEKFYSFGTVTLSGDWRLKIGKGKD